MESHQAINFVADLIQVQPAVVADPLRRLDLMPGGGIEAVVVGVGVALDRVGVGVVVPDDRPVPRTDDSRVVAVLDDPLLAEGVDPERLLEVDERAVAARQPSDDAIPLRLAMPPHEVVEHDLTG